MPATLHTMQPLSFPADAIVMRMETARRRRPRYRLHHMALGLILALPFAAVAHAESSDGDATKHTSATQEMPHSRIECQTEDCSPGVILWDEVQRPKDRVRSGTSTPSAEFCDRASFQDNPRLSR